MLNDMEPKTRKVIYRVFAVLSLIVGAVGVAYGALPDVELPGWQIAVSQVVAFIGGAIGYTAQSNTETREYDLNIGDGLVDEDAV